MHNAQAMKVGDSPEDLPYKVAGILLCVGAPLHDAVKQFTTSHSGDRRNEARDQLTQAWILALHPFCPAFPCPRPQQPSLQLHGQVEVRRALMNVFQSHNIGVADPATERKRLLVEHCIPFIWKSSALSPPLFSSFIWAPIPYQSLPPLGTVFLEHTLL